MERDKVKMNKKKIGIIGIVGIPASYGGFETLAENLVEELESKYDFDVICSGHSYSQKNSKYLSANLSYIPLPANGISSIFFDIIGILWLLIKKNEVILMLGVSGAIILPFVKIFSRSKIIINIDGAEWRREKWSTLARKYLRFSEALAVRFSDTIVADNQAIVNYVDKRYGKKSTKIAYGGNTRIEQKKEINIPHVILKEQNYFLSICRIEPENNVKMILNGFRSIHHEKLIFIGNWQASDYGQQLYNEFKTAKNIELLEPIYDIRKIHNIRRESHSYIHGHSAGGTNPSLVEMMHYNSHIIAYDCVFNRFTLNNLGSYFSDENELRKKIMEKSQTSLDKIKDHRTEIMKLAKKEYTWSKIASQYSRLFGDGD